MTKEELVRDVLCGGGKVAVVGASDKPHRPVSDVMSYLKNAGVVLSPVNPRLSGKEVSGAQCLSCIADLPDRVDIIAVFVSEALQGTLEAEVLELPYKPALWFQPGTENLHLESAFREKGYFVVSGDCMKVAHRRYCTGQNQII